MSNVALVPYVVDPTAFKVEVDGEWIASIHTQFKGGHYVNMFWGDQWHPDVEVHNLQGGLAEAYQWAMRMHRKYPEWNRPGR